METTETSQEVLANEEVGGVSGLPSDAQSQNDAQVANDWKSLNEKEPEFMKQFKSLEDFKDKYKQLHNQYSSTVEGIKNKEKQAKVEQTTQAQMQEKAVKQQETIMTLVPQFLQNDMTLTPEMETALTEQGLDIRDVKLGAIELREKIQKAHSIVGGQEEYSEMINWAKDNTTDAQKAQFDKDVTGGMSEFAIRGMYAMYKEGVKGDTPTDRLRGQSAPSGIKPYASQDELMRDRNYINSARGRMDDVAVTRHKQRMALTPDAVIFGR